MGGMHYNAGFIIQETKKFFIVFLSQVLKHFFFIFIRFLPPSKPLQLLEYVRCNDSYFCVIAVLYTSKYRDYKTMWPVNYKFT